MWPKLVLTDPSAQGAVGAVDLGQAGVFDGVADRGAGAVRLHHADVPASTPAAANAARYTATCASTDGVEMFTVWPSWLAAVPRTTARIRSPSRSASGSRLSNTTAQPSARTNPSAATSKAWQRPVGDSMPCADPDDELARFQHHVRAAGEGKVAFAVVQAAAGQVHGEQPDEQAVSTVIAGPWSPRA